MFTVAVFIGLYSYLIFFLGIFNLLYKQNIILVTFLYSLVFLLYFYKKIVFRFKVTKLDKLSKIILTLLSLQFLVNLLGVLGPEISFDALWYHLTLPKIFLQNHLIFHIPGNLLYYSDMPKLTEMLYIFGLSAGSEIVPKLIHFCFGILTLIVIYKISGKFTSVKFSLLACLIFYSNLVVGWESITAYVDLSRTFFEVLGLWAFLNWFETKNRKWILMLGFMIGFSISVKLVSISSIIIYAFLFLSSYFLKYKNKLEIVKAFSIFILVSILIPIPLFIFSYLNTGNPFYPIFSQYILGQRIFQLSDIFNFPNGMYNLFLNLSDPISPVYLIFIPVIFVKLKHFSNEIKLIFVYVLLSIFVWYFTQSLGGGRFIMSYLPIFSVLCVITLDKLKDVKLARYLLILILFTSFISIGYRGAANAKFIPIYLGRETKSEFLSTHLNFSFGDFYDTDNYFASYIKQTDKVLLFGFHNLYYVNFPYIDSSFIKKGDKFNYIAVQNSNLPKRFSNWNQIYYNKLTKVKLYSLEGKTWVY
jgi:hypothetical protein